MTERREKRTYTEEFKKQLIQLHKNGKPRAEIKWEYDLTATAFDKWVIKRNADRYSISAQCRILGISCVSYYYEVKVPKDETPLEDEVQTAYMRLSFV